jgi:hypothetical protein
VQPKFIILHSNNFEEEEEIVRDPSIATTTKVGTMIIVK